MICWSDGQHGEFVKSCSLPTSVRVSVSMQAHRQVLPLKSEVISSLRSSVSTPSLSQCIEELVFNSLDAKATCIAVRVDLENYRIQVVDNGCGISSEDLTLVGQRYATSKCYGLEDLNTLAFFGCRGEFLASLSNISSVLEVISRPKNTKTTFAKLFQKGEVYEIGEAKEKRPAHGTTVTAYNVYYNLPVRQKNINVALDLERIRKRLEAFAIIHHHVSFSLRDDLCGSKIFQTHITLSPKSAFGFLFGHPKATTLKEIANSNRNFSVSGYLGTEGHANKNLQYIYVNKQLVLKTKLHKLVNHFLSRSLLLKSQRLGKYPDSPLNSDSLSHCQQSSPSKGQGDHAIFILDIKCLRSEYDIQYDNRQTFLEFQDWKGVSTCVEQALQQFLVNENLCLISEEEKYTKQKDEAYIEDSSEESSSESEETTSQPPPAQLAKLQKYGYNISTRNCTNNLQSRVVTRAHLKAKKENYSVERNKADSSESVKESVDSGKLEETPQHLTNNSEPGGSSSTDLLPLNGNDESLDCNTKQIQQSEDRVQKNLPPKDEDENTKKAINLKKIVDAKNKEDGGCKQVSSDKLKVTCCMDEVQDRVEEPEELKINQQKSELYELFSKPLGKHEINKQQILDAAEGTLVSKRNEEILTVNQNEEMNPKSSTSCTFLPGKTPRSSGSSFESDVIFLEGRDDLLKARGQLCRVSTLAKEERDSRVFIPEVSSYNKSNVQDESESISVMMMPSCASTLPAGGDNSLKVSEDNCMDNQAFGHNMFPLQQDGCSDDGYNKTFDNSGQDLHKKSSDKVSHLPEIIASVDSTLGCNSRKGPVKCGPEMSSPSSRSTMVIATHDRVMSTTNRGEGQIGSITEDSFKLSKEEAVEESLSSQHCEAEAAVSEEDISMVTCEAESHKRCIPTLHVSKKVHFKSFGSSNDDSDIHKVPFSPEKNQGEKFNASFNDDGSNSPRKEVSQDQSTTCIEIQRTSTYTSSLSRFKNGLKSRPVNVAANLAAKISEALNKSKAKTAIFGTNFSERNTSHSSRMRSHWFPVTEDNLPMDIRDAPSIRLSQKLAWLKKCKPSERVDKFTSLKEGTPSLEQSLVKDFYTERKPLSSIQRKGTSEDNEMTRCLRRPKLDEIQSHPDHIHISHSFISSRNSSEHIKRRDTLLQGSNLPCKIQKCSLSGLISSSGQFKACLSGPRKDTTTPSLSTQQQNYSGHFTLENSHTDPFDRGSIAHTRRDNLSMNRAPPHSDEVHGDLQNKSLFVNTNSINKVNPHCRLNNHGFMSTGSFIQIARDILPGTNPHSITVDQDSLVTCSYTNIVNEGGIKLNNFVNTVEKDVCNDHLKHLDRGPNVSDGESVLTKSYTGQQSRYETAPCEDNGNSTSGCMSSSDFKAISEERHKEILSMIDNPSLLSPEIETPDYSDTHSSLICKSGNEPEVPFTRYKDSPMIEMLSTQPFHVQSIPVEGEEEFWRQNKTSGQLISQKEDKNVEDKPSESLKINHASHSKREFQIVENKKILKHKFSDMLPAVQGEESNFTKPPSKEGNRERSPCHMDMNWNMFNEENIDLLSISDKSPESQVPQIRSDMENKLVPHSRDNQLQTSDDIVPDVIDHSGPLHDDEVTSLQVGVGEPCVDNAGKDGCKIFDIPEVSTRVILAKDHTIVLQKTNSEHPLQKNILLNESKTSADHLKTSTEKLVRAGVDQKECIPPNEQNPSRERMAQPCDTEVSSTTDAQGLGSTLQTCSKKKGSDAVPWELYWFLPKTAKPFFPRPLQDRHPAVDKTATTQSSHLLDEFLMEENETANLQLKWKHGIPHIDKEACRSFDELFDNWQNPVFKTTDVDVPDSSTTRSISTTVKVHNSLHPYQFTKEIFDSIEVIGQLDKKFIVCLISTSIQRRTKTKPHLLVLIDQHAAHERIRLEQLTQDAYVDSEDDSDSEDISSPYLRDTTVPHLRSCRVIPPISINMTDEECRLAQAFTQKLKRFGVTVSISKSRKDYRAEVTELPACMVEREANMVKKARQTVAADLAEALVQECIQQLQDTGGSCASLPRTITKILNSQACRGAIKFGDPLALDDILSLLSQLSECKLPFQCAHGRPSIIPLLDFNHLTAKLHSQDPCSHHPKVNLQRFRRKIIETVDDET